MAWNTPITWAIRDAITMARLNAQVRDNLNYLFSRPRQLATVLGAGSDLTVTSTTNVAVDDAQFTLTLTTSGGLVEFNLSAQCQQTAITNYIYFDIIIDDTTYVSSQTGTPLTSGIWSFRPSTLSVNYGLPSQPFIYPVILSSGAHTFKLRWRVTGTTGTLKLSGGALCQFSAKEI